MKKKIIVRGPVLSRSGYGEQSRFALQCLRSREDYFDVYIIPTNWGKSSWVWEETEERRWIDEKIKETAIYLANGGTFDGSLQITIPNEWEPMAPINIGYTAGIETTKVAPQWVEKSYLMNHIIVISNHARDTFLNTTYQATDNNTGQTINDFRCQTPITTVNYCVRNYDAESHLDIELDYDFNFLCAAQFGPRKNVENTLRWFVEEFIDQEVGLVLKLNWHNDSLNDRVHTKKMIDNLLKQDKYKDRKCKIYLLHGSLKSEEMSSLYKHPKIKCLVSLTHGEGFGLPIFEAVCNELPVIAPDWSGHLDFLYMPSTDKKTKKTKNKAMFSRVDYQLAPIPQQVVWDGVLVADSQWCYADGGSYKMKLREVITKYQHKKQQAKKLKKWVFENFSEEQQYAKFVEPIIEALDSSTAPPAGLPNESKGEEDWLSEIADIVKEYE
jgi:hypothetical protein